EIDAAQHSQAVVVVDDQNGVSHSPHVAFVTLAPRHCGPRLRSETHADRCTETNVSAVRSSRGTGRRGRAARGLRSSPDGAVETTLRGADRARDDRRRSDRVVRRGQRARAAAVASVRPPCSQRARPRPPAAGRVRDRTRRARRGPRRRTRRDGRDRRGARARRRRRRGAVAAGVARGGLSGGGLARRVAAPPPPLPAELDGEAEPPSRGSALTATLLALSGATVFAAGATLELWPVWALGLALFASGLLVYSP